MGMVLNPEHERIIQEELCGGQYRDAQEVIGRALEALREKQRSIHSGEKERDPKRAVARIRERRKGITLGALSIKDLVNEGRR